MPATQRQKFYTDDINRRLHKKNADLFKFMLLLVDFGKVLCSSSSKTQNLLLERNIYHKY